MAFPVPSPDSTPVDRSSALYERVAMPVADAPTFTAVKRAVDTAFAPASVAGFFQSLQRKSVRIRDFASVLQSGALGPQTGVEYERLTPADQGQIRELYLASLEHVDLALRNKFFKLYAYY